MFNFLSGGWVVVFSILSYNMYIGYTRMAKKAGGGGFKAEKVGNSLQAIVAIGVIILEFVNLVWWKSILDFLLLSVIAPFFVDGIIYLIGYMRTVVASMIGMILSIILIILSFFSVI